MNERFLRELELDGVARLCPGASLTPRRELPGAPVQGVVAPASALAPITTLAVPIAGEGPSWRVVAHPEAFSGAAGKLLDAMLAAVGLRRDLEGDAAARAPVVLALLLGEVQAPGGVPAASALDPRHLLDHPADKARAWEQLLRARQQARAA